MEFYLNNATNLHHLTTDSCMPYPSGKGPAYSGPIRWGLFMAGPLR